MRKAARIDAWERVGDAKGFEGAILRHPLASLDPHWGYEVPMLEGDFVTEDVGTGFVHCAPSHGEDDYELFVKHHLVDRLTHNVLEDSSFAPHVPFFAGLQIFDAKGKEGKANQAVIARLQEAGTLLARGRMTHAYPHSWRSKAPVIFRNTPQWFVAIDKPLDDGMGTYGATIRERALTSIDQLVEWTPQTGRNRLFSMIEARPDWVLSRQRAWGVPLTCFVKRLAEGRRRDPARPGRQRPHPRRLRGRGRRRLVRARRQGAVPRQRPRPRRVGAGDGHPRRLVRLREHPRLRAARPGGRRLAGGPLPRGHRPASRLVPVLDAAGLRHRWAGRPTGPC